jgi:uncharacterized LabA/DUF88 family protein
VPHDDRLRIAVFIDFDNIEIGIKNTLGSSFDAGVVLEALKERGEVVAKTAYSDWQRAGGYSRMLTQHAIKMVQRNLTPGGDKNGADINLALDALEMAFTHPHINAFVIVGGDSDFISLVEKLKQYDKKVFVVGGRKFTSVIMQRNCHEFIAYENLVGNAGSTSSQGARRQAGREPAGERAPIDQVIPLVTRALKVLSEREVSPQLGLLKSTLLQLDSTFSERTYGAGSFRDFVQKLERAGVLTVQQGKGGWIVGPADGAGAPAVERSHTDRSHSERPHAEHAAADHATTEHASVEPGNEQAPLEGDAPRREGAPRGHGGAPAVTGSHADGVRVLKQVLMSAGERRWPLYLRHVKQLLRQANPSFDERTFGFANLTDLVRAAQRESWLRVDRDRQGVVRLFKGGGWAAAAETDARTGSAAPSAADEIDSPDQMDHVSESTPASTEPDHDDQPASTRKDVEAFANPESTDATLDEPLATPPKRRRRAPAPRGRSRARSPKSR